MSSISVWRDVLLVAKFEAVNFLLHVQIKRMCTYVHIYTRPQNKNSRRWAVEKSNRDATF